MTNIVRSLIVFLYALALVACGAPMPDVELESAKRHHCYSDTDCGALDFCDTEASGQCGGRGTCQPRGVNLYCSSLYVGVCGCDGQTYANDCERQASGVSKWANGACSDPTCPTTAPQSGGGCTQGNIACVYLISTGSNAGCVERITCTGGIWSAPVVVCPG